MGTEDFWKYALGDFLTMAPWEYLSKWAGKRFAIDLSILLNKYLRTDIDKLASTCDPIYKCPDLLQGIMEVHKSYIRSGIIPVYVYDGIAPLVKKQEKTKRSNERAAAGKEYTDLKERAVKEDSIMFTEEELNMATEARMKMAHPTAQDHSHVLGWMKSEGIQTYGSLCEADQQMVQLEKDDIVEGIISEDNDCVMLGGKLVLCKMRRHNGELQFKAFKREEFMAPDNPYNSKLCTYPNLIPDSALLLGCDYMKRVKNNGPVMIFGSFKNKKKNKNDPPITSGPRENNGMLDALAKAKDKVEYINEHGNNMKGPLTERQKETYWKSRKYILHAPVIHWCRETGKLSVVPLNDLARGATDQLDYFRSDCGLGALLDDEEMIRSIYECDILPLTRKPLNNYAGPFLPDGKTPALWFQELNFETDPISIQPTLCLVNWLRARNVDVHPLRSSRQYIEDNVRNCLRVHKPISDTPLAPISGVHNGFKHLKNRTGNNNLDNWCNNYLGMVSRLERMSDDVLYGYLGCRAERSALHERVMRLVQGGNYNPKSIRCRNVESTEEATKGEKCILFRFDCLSSRTSVIHQVYAVFVARDRKELS